MTEKLYYKDSFLKEFDAIVLSCTPEGKKYSITLDATAFYPEGGGQGADFGILGTAQVLDVQEKEDTIFHYCDKPLEIGASVHGTIDWERRFDHMQQHSGEHIVSGMLCATYHCDNVGFHMGADVVTIDYNTEIPWSGVLEIEQRANQYIWENHPFVELWPTKEELKDLPYRSKKELTGPVRITSFPGADMCACCGTHVKESGQVGLVKFLSCQKFKDGVRLELLCGKRALQYLSTSWEQNLAIGQALSVKCENTFASVERLKEELLQTKLRADQLEEESFKQIAKEYAEKGNVLHIHSELSADATRRLCDAIASSCGGRAAVFAGTDESYKYTLIHNGQDISAFIKKLNTSLNGRGGGRNGFAQGSVHAMKKDILAFFAEN